MLSWTLAYGPHDFRRPYTPHEMHVLFVTMWGLWSAAVIVAGVALYVYIRKRRFTRGRSNGTFNTSDLRQLLQNGQISLEEFQRLTRMHGANAEPYQPPHLKRPIAPSAPAPPKAIFCAVCGYDLRATPGRCPECGTIRPHK